MKHKSIALFLVLATVCSVAMAQPTEEKKSKNYFIGAGIGAMGVINDGLNTPTFNIDVQFGRLITPTWGARGVISGFWQSLDEQNYGYHKYCKKFVELNLDAMINLNSLFGNKNYERKWNWYLFGGPTINLGSAVSAAQNTTYSYTADDDNNYTYDATGTYSISGQEVTIESTTSRSYGYSGVKARIGATVGLGLAYDVNKYWAINLEARYGVSPSNFGWGSDCRAAESTIRANIGFLYTFGGKSFAPCGSKVDKDAINDEVNRYHKELEEAQAELAKCREAKPQVVEREVVKEVAVSSSYAIFFKIGSAQIDDYGQVQIQLAAKSMKLNPQKKYKVQAYADKATGTPSGNQTLTDKRAKAVYDALIAEGVDKDQLILESNGGTDNLFGKDHLNRVVIAE